MPVHFRVIRYEFEREEDLDRQLSKSLAEGLHLFPNDDSIFIRDIPSTSMAELDVLNALGNLPNIEQEYIGCITKEQAAILNLPSLD